MDMHPVESSSISAIGHKDGVLRVKYKNGGLYNFYGVTAEEFHHLKGAKSIGKHLNRMKIPGRKHVEK